MKRTVVLLAVLTTMLLVFAPTAPAAGDDGEGGESIHSPGPQGRCCFAMAYDPDTRLTMLFGGFDNDPEAVLDQTWTWDGTSWHILNPAHKPLARKSVRMVWAADLHQMVLYGGLLTASDTGTADNATWLWDDATGDWLQCVDCLNTDMPRLSSYGMAYDSTNHQVVLYGGNQGTGPVAATWIMNTSGGSATQWQNPNPVHLPPPLGAPAMTYDPLRGQTVLFGGATTGGSLKNETWFWDSVDWTKCPGIQCTGDQPAARQTARMDFDPVAKVIVMFGGAGSSDVLADTWVWTGTNWSQCVTGNCLTGAPVKRAANGMAPDRNGMMLMMQGQNNDPQRSVRDDFWTFQTKTRTWTCKGGGCL